MNVSKDLAMNAELVYAKDNIWEDFMDIWLEESKKGNMPFENWDTYDLDGYEHLEVKWVRKTPMLAFRDNLALEDFQLSDEELAIKYPDWKEKIIPIERESPDRTYMYIKEAETASSRLLVRGIYPISSTIDLEIYLTEEELNEIKANDAFDIEDYIRCGKVNFSTELDLFSFAQHV